MAVTRWINANGGAWETAENWDNGVPTPTVDAIFDADSFSISGKTVTISSEGNCQTFDCSQVSNAFTLSFVGTVSLNVYKDFTLHGTNVIFIGFGGSFKLKSTTTCDIKTNGLYINEPNTFYIDGVGGTFYLMDDFSIRNTVLIQNGTLNMNNHNLTTARIQNNSNGIFYMGSGTLNLYSASLSCVLTSLGKLYAETSTLIFNNTITSTKNWSIQDGLILNTVQIIDDAVYTIYINKSLTINNLFISPGHTIQFDSGKTLSIANLNATGTALKKITIASKTTSYFNINYIGTGYVACDYLILNHCHTVQQNKFFAGTHSTDSGDNTGWIFSDYTEQLLFSFKANSIGSSAVSGKVSVSDFIRARSYSNALVAAMFFEDLRMMFNSQGFSDSNSELQFVSPVFAESFGVSFAKASFVCFTYPVEIFISRSAITEELNAKSIVTTEFTHNTKIF